jgi:hypothetical protein
MIRPVKIRITGPWSVELSWQCCFCKKLPPILTPQIRPSPSPCFGYIFRVFESILFASELVFAPYDGALQMCIDTAAYMNHTSSSRAAFAALFAV